MTFEQYCAVIETTARDHGWSMFLPSLCEPGARAQLRVYEVLPANGTDCQVAHQWARPLLDQGVDLYLAYRDTQGCIAVQEFVAGRPARCQRLYFQNAAQGVF